MSRRRHKTVDFRVRGSRTGWVFALACLLAVSAIGQAQSPTPLRINRASANCANPSLVAGPNGSLYAVWDGYGEAGRGVWFAERAADGVWKTESLVGAEAPGESLDPAVAVGPDDQPHVVWLAGDGPTRHVYISQRTGVSTWTPARRLDVTDELNCQSPSIAFDANGRHAVVWQAGMGAMYRVYGAAEDDNGVWTIDLLGGDQAGDYSFSPMLIAAPELMAFWHACDFDGFHPRAAWAPKTAGADWKTIDLVGFDALPKDRLPMLVSDKQGGAVAVWTDADGDSLERVWLARMSDGGKLATMFGDDRPHAVNHSPAIDVDPERQRVAFAWVSEDNGRNTVAVRLAEPGRDAPSIDISDTSDTSVEAPRLVLTPSGQAHVVWYSKRATGGLGNVYHVAVSF